MIVDRYFFKEIFATLMGVLVVILLIFTSKHFVRYMSDAAAGDLPTGMIVQLLSLFVLSYLVMILPFALYIAVLTTLGRMYKDNEVTALEACGIGIPRVTRTVAMVGLVMAIIVGVLSFYIAPLSEEAQYAIRDQAKVESEFAFLEPGRFHEIRGGRGVFYVESIADSGDYMENVFVYLDSEGKRDVFSSSKGRQETDPITGAQYIILEEGHRFEELPKGQGYRIHTYQRSGIRIEAEEMHAGSRPRIAWTTRDLIESGKSEDYAELHWRLSMPIACLLLTLMAVLISRTNPRQGRFAKLFGAFIIYVVYLYLLMLARTWVKNDVVPEWLGMWWAHLLMLASLLYLASKQFGGRWLLAQLRIRPI